MRLDIVIPTRDRLEKLSRCIASLAHNRALFHADIRCFVYFDTNIEIFKFGKEYPFLRTLIQVDTFPEYTAPKLWNYHLKQMDADGMMYLNDDVEMLGDGVMVAKNQFVLHYPDYDGVMGFVQENLRGKFDTAPAAFGIVGRGFADRFPDRQVFCPDYHHLWIDRELELAAKHWGRFHVAEQVKLNHYHPCLGKQYEDDTHNHIRKWKGVDQLIWNSRKSKGWVWGIDFNLLGSIK